MRQEQKQDIAAPVHLKRNIVICASMRLNEDAVIHCPSLPPHPTLNKQTTKQDSCFGQS